MSYFAVIDTETNWIDQVMSIGTVIAECDTMQPVDSKYHIITPEYTIGGMFESTLFSDTNQKPIICDREGAIKDLLSWFSQYDVDTLFAYNASFDYHHLPELRSFHWYDIMRLAAYRQYNPYIPACADCFRTGRLKKGYGVESMLRLLTGRFTYCESHNALQDAMDELQIIKLLSHPLSDYIPLI